MATLHGDVASAIGQQVERMILQAKKDSEQRVRHDLSVARTQLTHMESVIADLTDRVARCAAANAPGNGDQSRTVDRAFLSSKIAQLEQKWGSEVKALKQDLHRTILAHNHNSDLMRHHRDALDEARKNLESQTPPKAEHVEAQINKMDSMIRAGQAKMRSLDALAERLTVLESHVADVVPTGLNSFPGMMPGMAGLMGQQTQMLGAQREQAGMTKRKTDKTGEPPTEEEVRARLMQAALSKNSDMASSFNAEAPPFVPRGASSPDATEAATPTSMPTATASADNALSPEDAVTTDEAAVVPPAAAAVAATDAAAPEPTTPEEALATDDAPAESGEVTNTETTSKAAAEAPAEREVVSDSEPAADGGSQSEKSA